MGKTTILEYIWIGGDGEIRSKIRVQRDASIPEWNFDGSSTGQVEPTNLDTEIILQPRATYYHPLLSSCKECEDAIIVLCDTWNPDGTPHSTNSRHDASLFFASVINDEPWFGLEQEYFLLNNASKGRETGGRGFGHIFVQDGDHYCGQDVSPEERKIVVEHLHACIQAGLTISGLNAEVARNQWEFQIGPVEGISAGDQMIVARFLLERIAEKYEHSVLYYPKPRSDINGSGCHINFSTAKMRVPGTGIEHIHSAINNLSKFHVETLKSYGKGNERRLTGKHETSSMDTFSYGVGTRNTSIRIPNSTINMGGGYFEDRRPAANIDPYAATYALTKAVYTFSGSDTDGVTKDECV